MMKSCDQMKQPLEALKMPIIYVKTKDKCIQWHNLISMLISSINYMHGHVGIWSFPGEVLGLFTCLVEFQFIWTAFIICDYISTM